MFINHEKKRYARVDHRRSTPLNEIALPIGNNAKLYDRIIPNAEYNLYTVLDNEDSLNDVINDIGLMTRAAKGIKGVLTLAGYNGYERVYVCYAAHPERDTAPYYRVQLLPTGIRKNDIH